MTDKDFFDFQLIKFAEKYSLFKGKQNYHLFTLLCIKYYFFSEASTPFDPDFVIDYLTDGANDGGIDAVFNDPLSENNDMIILQSKYYNSSTLQDGEIFSELVKINETIENIKKSRVQSYSQSVVKAFRKAQAEMEDEGKIRVYFFTSFSPSSKKERTTNLKKYSKFFSEYGEFNIYYGEDIKTQYDVVENGKILVEKDKLMIDDTNNYLTYQDSVILNVSARSLQDLQNRRGNALLGLNLRYHIKGPIVDEGIKKTIQKDSDNFWYKNNGILIVCDKYEISGKDLHLTNFSIVNGGQTTHKIGQTDLNKDFFLQCKVVVSKGNSDEEKHNFINSIAEATNTQKPIKKADLKANSYEQVQLKQALKNIGVFYAAKKGEKPTPQYNQPYLITSLEAVGKLSLAGVLLMPGSARSNSQKMYNDEYYHTIFGRDANPGVIKDLLKLDYYYEKYKKNPILKTLEPNSVQPMAGNGKTFTIACISLLCKINHGVFTFDEILSKINDTDALKIILRKMGSMKCLIQNNIDNESDYMNDIFICISDEILGYCYGNELEKVQELSTSLAPSDFLKQDTNFYKHIIQRLKTRYLNNKSFKTAFDTIFVK